MEWQNYFCDDVKSGANLQKFPQCSKSCNLHQRIPGTCWNYKYSRIQTAVTLWENTV
jgi:hypothetical protein